jgi:hypothetical protein
MVALMCKASGREPALLVDRDHRKVCEQLFYQHVRCWGCDARNAESNLRIGFSSRRDSKSEGDTLPVIARWQSSIYTCLSLGDGTA